MKSLSQHIHEALKVGSKSKVNKYNYHPQTKKELEQLIEQLLRERGLNADLNDIDTSEITDMSWLFCNSKFNGDISKWDVRNVRDMSHMFSDSQFNGDISGWNAGKRIFAQGMFSYSPLADNPPEWYNAEWWRN